MEDCDQWLLDDYEKTERFFNDPDNNIVQVFCPICQVNLLNLNENIITCACGLRQVSSLVKSLGLESSNPLTFPFRLYYPLSLSEFFESVLLAVKKHEQNNCPSPVQFFAEPKDGFNVVSLQAMCASCDYFNTLIGQNIHSPSFFNAKLL